MAVVLALDIGSTFAKAQRFDDTGAPVGDMTRRPTSLGPDGRADLEDVMSTIDHLVDDVHADGARPDAVAVSSAWHTLVGLDSDGQATTELSTWLDDRASAEAAELRLALAHAGDVRHRTGAPIHPSLPPARLLWFARHRPDVFTRTRRWCSLPEAVAGRWFGEPAGPSSSIASGSGLYDQRAAAWDGELLEALSLASDALLPVDDSPRAALAGEYRARWPALADIPWFPVLGDGASAAVSSGCATPGRAALTIGTSAAARVLCDPEKRWKSALPAPLFGYLLDAGRPVVGAARSNAGDVVAWAEGVLRVDSDDPVAAATAGRPPGGHGLDADASLVIERSPHWPLAATARVDGLRRTTTALDIVQALVEDVALGVADAVAALEAWAGRQTLVLAGGASRVAGWRQLLADAIGRPLLWSPVAEASARGAALVALEQMGAAAPVVLGDEEVVEPDAERAAAFAELRVGERGRRFAASWGS